MSSNAWWMGLIITRSLNGWSSVLARSNFISRISSKSSGLTAAWKLSKWRSNKNWYSPLPAFGQHTVKRPKLDTESELADELFVSDLGTLRVPCEASGGGK